MSAAKQLTFEQRVEEARVRIAVEDAAIAELQAGIRSGKYIWRKEYEDKAFALARTIRDMALGCSARYAAEAAAECNEDPIKAAQIIDKLAYEAMVELANKYKHKPFLYRGLMPDPQVTVSEWADQYRVLTSRSASETGPYRTARTPYLREIMDSLSATSTVQRVVFKKAAQLGVTEAGNCWAGYVIDHSPGPMLCVQPTVELAKRFSKQRLDPMISESERLRDRVAPARERDSGNTVLAKEFTGGIIVVTGANSAVGLRSMPVRYLFCDEVDAYPPDTGGEGDALSLAYARTRTFGFRSKTFLVSTPRIKGSSLISREYDRTDQRRYFVPCPKCDHAQVLQFDQLRYTKHERGGRIECGEVTYECEACKALIQEHHKTTMLARGEWRATAETNDPYTRGYHLNALYSPNGWLSWQAIADTWENDAAKNADARKAFVNTILGEDYEEEASAVPDWERIYNRRETWQHRMVPERGLFLTAGVDVQGDRLECDVWAWGRGLESWHVEHITLDGEPGKADVWNLMTALLSRTWDHENGSTLSLMKIAVDTGAYTQDVYQWVRTQDKQLVMPVKGNAAYDRTMPVSGPTRIDMLPNGTRLKGGLNLWTVSVSFFKREWYRNLELSKPTDEQLASGATYPPGYAHISTAVSDEWVKQCVAEQPVLIRSRRGFAVRTEWRQTRPRNESLDMRVYARAAAWMLGADRWSDKTWRHHEAQLGVTSPAAPAPAPATPKTPAPGTPQAPTVPRNTPAPMVPRQPAARTPRMSPNRRVGYSSW